MDRKDKRTIKFIELGGFLVETVQNLSADEDVELYLEHGERLIKVTLELVEG